MNCVTERKDGGERCMYEVNYSAVNFETSRPVFCI